MSRFEKGDRVRICYKGYGDRTAEVSGYLRRNPRVVRLMITSRRSGKIYYAYFHEKWLEKVEEGKK